MSCCLYFDVGVSPFTPDASRDCDWCEPGCPGGFRGQVCSQVLLRTQRRAVLSVKYLEWAVLKKAASSNTRCQAVEPFPTTGTAPVLSMTDVHLPRSVWTARPLLRFHSDCRRSMDSGYMDKADSDSDPCLL